MPRVSPSAVLLLACTLALASTGHASPQNPEEIRRVAERFLHTQAASFGKTEVTVTPPRARLAACHAPEAFALPGARSIGRLTVGVRCAAPVAWTVYLAAEVKAVGDYVTTARALPANHILTPDDLTIRQGDLGSLPVDVATTTEAIAGYRTISPVAANAPLRTGVLRPPMVVQQGQTTRVQLTGPGFAISTEGQALANASRGERVRVRTASGTVISGVALDGQRVDVSF